MESRFKVERWLGDLETFRLLVTKGFRVMDDLNQEERTKLLTEIFQNRNLDMIAEVCDNGLKLDLGEVKEMNFDDCRSHPLMLAIKHSSPGDVSMVELLVEKGCPVDFSLPRRPYWTPLLTAVTQKQPGIAEFLLSRGAQPARAELSMMGGSHDTRYIQLLQQYKIGLNRFYCSLLHGALREQRSYFGNPEVSDSDDTFSRQEAMISALLDAGCDPNLKVNRTRNTSGHELLLMGDELKLEQKSRILDLLTQYGLDLEEVNAEGQTMLHVASLKEKRDYFRLLLERGVNVNPVDRKGNTPLLLLYSYSDPEPRPYIDKINTLLDYNPDVNIENSQGQTVLGVSLMIHWRNKNLCPEMVTRLLKETECDLYRASYSGCVPRFSTDVISLLIQSGTTSRELFTYVIRRHHQERIDNGELLVTHADPTFDTAAVTSPDYISDDDVIPDDGPGEVWYPGMRSLRCLAGGCIRGRILEVTGGRSLFPRARVLPLPPPLIDLVTLDTYKLQDIGPEDPSVPDLYNEGPDSDLDSEDGLYDDYSYTYGFYEFDNSFHYL